MSDSTSVSKPWDSQTDGGQFNTGGMADVSDVNDWQSMDWKTIKTAIVGGAAVAEDEQSQAKAKNAEGNVSPQSLVDAGAAFNMAYVYMTDIADNLRQQIEGFVGDGGPWTGAGAKSFKQTMSGFADKLEAHAEQINGDQVPQQLYNSANM